MGTSVPMVEYLELGDQPRLVANECTSCGARYFDRRNACANCGGLEFAKAPVATEGEVRAFTIVGWAAPGVPAPYVAAVIDCLSEAYDARTAVPSAKAREHALAYDCDRVWAEHWRPALKQLEARLPTLEPIKATAA